MSKFFAILLFVGFCSCNSEAQNGSIDTKAFEAALNSGTYQLLDVRTAGEFQSGHLKNALQADWNNQAQFIERIQYIDKTKPLLVYCASGVRSNNAAQYLKGIGFKNVQNLKGGLTAWKLDGKAVESAGNQKQLSTQDYDNAVQKAPLVLVDFGAEWCPPCKKMEPVLKSLQSDASLKYAFVKVDGGMDIDVMKAHQVEALPVFIVYKNGKEVWRKQGIVEQAELKKQLTQ
ncbi:MAG: thioredoxin fold domain-containing protein [Chitinophagaceae bacterium]|nr:thioredoxin fold domain-containing protein [Chitinophagaceae bacterium]